ncbi:hypothetical protein [Shewanella woodyi]|uniref:hypothetical protein n=1 Tax=Shewanella woodyi TaxID=60961 RepID=UPI0007F8BCB8|nr:hypothetical protein [Shewanella woodyi]
MHIPSNNLNTYLANISQPESKSGLREIAERDDIETIRLNSEDSIQLSGLGINLGNLFEGKNNFQQQTGIPKQLTESEKKQETEIHNKIDSIFNKYMKEPNKDEQKTLEETFKKIDEIFADGKVTPEENKQLNALSRKMEETSSGEINLDKMSDKDKKELDKQFAALDKLYSIDKLEQKEINSLNELLKSLDDILAKLDKELNESQTTYGYNKKE